MGKNKVKNMTKETEGPKSQSLGDRRKMPKGAYKPGTSGPK